MLVDTPLTYFVDSEDSSGRGILIHSGPRRVRDWGVHNIYELAMPSVVSSLRSKLSSGKPVEKSFE